MRRRLLSGRFEQIETEAVAHNRLRWGSAAVLWGYQTRQALKAEQSPSAGKFFLSACTASVGLSHRTHTSSGFKLQTLWQRRDRTFRLSPPPSYPMVLSFPSRFLAAAAWVLPFSSLFVVYLQSFLFLCLFFSLFVFSVRCTSPVLVPTQYKWWEWRKYRWLGTNYFGQSSQI